MNITEFLLARVSEDEAAWTDGIDLVTRPDFARLSRHMLAECAAKRRIVEMHAPEAFADDPDLTFCRHDQRTAGVWPCDTIRILASVYADHRDYDPAWRDADD